MLAHSGAIGVDVNLDESGRTCACACALRKRLSSTLSWWITPHHNRNRKEFAPVARRSRNAHCCAISRSHRAEKKG